MVFMLLLIIYFQKKKVWQHTFYNELRIAPEEHPIILTESPLNPKSYREKTTEIMFESIQCPSFYMASSSMFSLYSTGGTFGVVVDIGHDCVYTVPILEGHALYNCTTRLDIGGSDITD